MNRIRAYAQALRAKIRTGDGYVIEPLEYVNPNGPPPGDLFADPEETTRLLERTRQSILNRPRPDDPEEAPSCRS